MERLGSHLIEASGPTPLYRQIFLVLKDRIRRGDYAAGDPLPGEEELARLFDVSRITAKRALNDLAAERLVVRRRGLGTTVAGGVSAPVVTSSFDTLVRALEQMGADTAVELLDLADNPATGEVADLLDVPPGETVRRLTRLRRLDGEPFSHIVTFLPEWVAQKIPSRSLRTQPMLRLLAKAGLAIAEAEQWITAAGAEPGVAQALGLPAGSPVLRIARVTRTREHVPVQLIYAHYRPERFAYHMVAPARGEDDENG